MDDATLNLLMSADLQDLIPVFKDHSIRFQDLKGLTPELIAQLTPIIGYRARLQLLVANETNKKISNAAVPEAVLEVNSGDSVLKASENTVTKDRDRSPNSHRSPKSHRSLIELDLRSLLEKNLLGQGLVKKYDLLKKLDRKDRALLVKIIIENVLLQSTELRACDFEFMVDGIRRLFPTECRETYFVPASKKGRHSLGCLPNRYRFLKQVLGKNNLYNEADDQSDKTDVEVTEEFLNKQNLLKTHWEEADVLKLWSETSPVRVDLLKKSTSKDVATFLKDWPSLSQPYGYKLICIDFNSMYPLKSENLLNQWDIISQKLLAYMKDHFHDYTTALLLDSLSDSSGDALDLTLFKLLHKVLPPAMTSTPNKKKFHPSVADSQESFLLQISDSTLLDDEIAEKKAKLQFYKLKLQPFIIVVGTSCNISSILLYCDGIFYKLDSILKAVDCLFKIYQVLNYEYPVACGQVWLFIQQGIFKIKTPYDGHLKMPRVSTFLNDLDL